MDAPQPVTKWDMERALAQEEIAQIERECAIEDILQRMKRHDIRLDELRKRGAVDWPAGGERKGSYDPIFGWR